ncbi:MAG: site-2 protease family protein [Oscillatoria sp. Prado101]|jgi:Zn-dependent protease/CBS domain-containing protein|nr:site-2 protease family protein [Oscillatoria sp. Prado101]
MNGFRVGNLFGIPLYVHPSWFFILGLVTFSYGSQLAEGFPRLGGALPWLLGLLAALLLFASVLAHELGHSFVALRQGINVKSITLFLFGGLAHLEEESKTPAEAFWVAIAGPLVSFALFGIFTAIGVSTGISGAPAAIVTLVASINLALALFNLIPGLPLDGGNILKAIVWKITGNPYKGVVFASRAGQILAWIAIISGLVFGRLWNVLIGWFLLGNAGRSAQYATLQNKLAGLTAADAVTPDSPIVSERLSLRDFANDYIIGKPSRSKFLVTNDFGQLSGAIAVDDLKTVPTNFWPHTQVRELALPVELSTTVKPQQSLLEVVALLETQKVTELPVIRDNGEIVGLVRKDEIIRLIQVAQAKPV